MDEWRWEWSIPITRREVRPESFEGSMGMVWYELEAKCLFRWDKVNKDGLVISQGDVQSSLQAMDGTKTLKASNWDVEKGQPKTQLGATKFLKGIEATTSTAKSIAQVFGKLRAGNKEKKPQYAGDFILGTQHDEFIKESINQTRKAPAVDAKQEQRNFDRNTHLTGQSGETLADLGSTKLALRKPLSDPDPVPYLIRKLIKLHVSHPTQKAFSNPGLLPPPPMSLPTLPSTRRLQAIIPGEKIQVQIQVPSTVSIPGYVHMSHLVPSTKTGGLIRKNQHCDKNGELGLLGTGTSFRDQYIGQHTDEDPKSSRHLCHPDPRYPDKFQVALTIRKITKHDISSSDVLRRRYENSELSAKTAKQHANNNSATRDCPHGSIQTPVFHEISSSCSTSGVGMATTAAHPNGSGVRIAHESAEKTWRREIRVRKVKCEFWQKEICRIPIDDTPSRSIKIPLGPAFIYSEIVDSAQPLPTLKPPPRPSTGGRKGNGSLESGLTSTLQPPGNSSPATGSHTSTVPRVPSNQPFVLLIPVPLDYPKLRQTYAWPSSDTPSAITPSAYDLSVLRGVASELGFEHDSELDSLSHSTMYDAGDSSSLAEGFTNPVPLNASAVKARIEIKHYLSFRLSIDILEYEGELEQEDIDKEATEEQQFQQAANQFDSRDTGLTLNPPLSSRDMLPSNAVVTPASLAFIGTRHYGPGPVSATNVDPISGSSSSPAGQLGVGTTAVASGLVPIQPALRFLNSAAGLLDMEPDASTLRDMATLGVAYDQWTGRKDSQGTHGTEWGDPSGNNGTGHSSGLMRAQKFSSVNDTGRGTISGENLALNTDAGAIAGVETGGLKAVAFEDLEKKASTSRLSNVLGTIAASSSSHYSEPRQQPSRQLSGCSQVAVRKLKDFVIRVPIRVVLQVDELPMTDVYGTTEGNGSNAYGITFAAPEASAGQ
ncbi:hypothetical protein BGX28_005548 [Mortierella sp. GBA30]|nr:hypothetical protein BGX28_005548 [Mortierella sp. GBA30]